MDIAAKKMKPKPEEYFSAEEYEWLQKVAAYDRDDSERFVFADDGEVAEVCSNYADDILNEEDDWFFALHLEQNSDYVPKYADSPEFGRVLVRPALVRGRVGERGRRPVAGLSAPDRALR